MSLLLLLLIKTFLVCISDSLAEKVTVKKGRNKSKSNRAHQTFTTQNVDFGIEQF